MSTSPATAPAERGRAPAFRAFEFREFRLIFSAAALWHIGRWMETVVLSWLALELTNSPWSVALVGFFRTLPNLVLGLVSGVVADRVNRKLVMVTAQTLNVVTSAAILALLLTDNIRPWHLYLGALLLGTAWAVDFPSRRALLTEILGPKLIAAGLSLEAAAMTSGKVLGPFLGGGLLDLGGGRTAYVLLTIAYVTTFQFMIRTKPDAKRTPSNTSVLRSIKQGFAYVRTRPLTMGILAGTIVANFAIFPYAQFVAVMARDVLHISPTLMGMLLAAEGLGAFAMALFLASRRQFRLHGLLFTVGVCIELVCLVIFSMSEWYLLSALTLVVMGCGFGLFVTLQATSILLDSAPEMRGRAMGMLALCIGGLPLGNLVYGQLAEQFTTPTAMTIMAVFGMVTMALVVIFTRLPWRTPSTLVTSVATTVAPTPAGR